MCPGHNGHHHEHSFIKQEEMELERIKSEKMEEGHFSDEGLGHSGSDGESNRIASPTNLPRSPKSEHSDGIHSLDSVGADGKRKEDLYKCRYCDRTFCYLCHLKVHERVHTGEKPYNCSYCDCTFSQPGSLTVHMRIHTGEKPYECRICLKKFRHINSLRRHQRQVHRKTPAEVDASPRGGDTPFHMGHPQLALSSPQTSPRSMTPQSTASGAMFHPYQRPQLTNHQPAMKSALELRSQLYAGLQNPLYAQMQQLHSQAGMNPYLRTQGQIMQHQMQQMQQQLRIQQQQQQPKQLIKQTNHSISSMLNKAEPSKPKKMGFSISALVGDESESSGCCSSSGCHSEETTSIEEIVDVVSDDQSTGETSGCCGSSDEQASGSVSPAPLIDADLRLALTTDPSTLSADEKDRLRRKLAQIALGQLDRNPSEDSGISSNLVKCA